MSEIVLLFRRPAPSRIQSASSAFAAYLAKRTRRRPKAGRRDAEAAMKEILRAWEQAGYLTGARIYGAGPLWTVEYTV